MTRSGGTRRRDPKAPFGKCDHRLLKSPIDFIHAEHMRHRELCQAAEEVALAETFDALLGDAIATFLEMDMALHVIDEEEDLFPMLRRRVEPGAVRIIGLLSGEHAADEVLARTLSTGLRKALTDGAPSLPEPLRNALLTFADRERRHLTVENAIVLPLATKCLTPRDLIELSRRMAGRRGISLPEGAG